MRPLIASHENSDDSLRRRALKLSLWVISLMPCTARPVRQRRVSTAFNLLSFSLFFSPPPSFVLAVLVEKEKPKMNLEELQIRKVKKKKKKKHKEGEKRKRPKMYSKSIQTDLLGPALKVPPLLHQAATTAAGAKEPKRCSPHHGKSPEAFAPPRPGRSQLPPPGLEGLEFRQLIHVEQQPNGGALVAHAYCNELSRLSPVEMQRFAQEFVTLAFSEDEANAAHYVMGIIHGAAAYLPDFLDYFSYKFPNSPVKMEILGKKDIETTTMANFHAQVRSRPMSVCSLCSCG